METRQHSTGGLPITLAGLKEFAKVGCDLCNAFKLKLTDPRSKTRDTSSDQSADTCSLLYYDQFGRVEQPSAQFGYHYAHLFSSPKKNIAWLHGSKDLSETTVADIHKAMLAMLLAWFPQEKVKVIRMDSFSSNKGKLLRQLFLDSLVHGQFSPPGQHAFLGDLERWWYSLFVRALIALRHRSVPPSMWFNAM